MPDFLTQIKRLLGKEDLQSQTKQTITGNRALPTQSDEYGATITMETLDRVMLDPIIAGAVNLLILRVIAEEAKVTGAVPAPSKYKGSPEEAAEYERSEEIRETLDKMINGWSQPLSSVLYQVLTAVVYGASVCEKIYGLRDGRYLITDLKYKPRTRYAFVVDEFNTVAGVVDSQRTGEVSREDIVPAEKLFIFTYRSLYGDPRGQSILRQCIPYWRMKCRKIDEYAKYLTLFGSPALVGTLPELAASTSPKEILDALRSVKSGGDMVVPHGTEVAPINVQNNESLYINFINFCNKEMVTGILGSTRATMEAENGSRADSETSVGLLGSLVASIQQSLAEAIKDSIFYPIVEANWGREAADEFTPSITFATGSEQSVYQLGAMVASLYNCGYIDKSQMQGLDAQLNLPERDYDSMIAEQSKPSIADLVDAQVPQEARWRALGYTDEQIKDMEEREALKANSELPYNE